MPNIRVYSGQGPLPESGGGQISGGVAFGARERRAAAGIENVQESITRFGQQLTELKEKTETTRLNAETAAAQAELTNAWRETLRTADPNDPDTAKRFMEEQVQPRLQQIGELATTTNSKQYFERLSANLNANFLQTTAAGQANLAGAQSVADFNSTINNLSSTVIADPTSFDSAVAMLKIMGDGFVQAANLSSEDKIKLLAAGTETLAKSAILGYNDANPDLAEQVLKSGQMDEFISGTDKATLLSMVETERNRRRAEARRQREELDEVAQEQWMNRFVQNDITVGEVVADDRLTPASQRVFLNMIEARANGTEKLRSDPATYQDLIRRSVLDDNDPLKLTAAEVREEIAAGRLIPEDANRIFGLLAGAKDPEIQSRERRFQRFLDNYKSSITNSSVASGILDDVGDRAYQDFIEVVQKQWEAGLKRGLSADDMLNSKSSNFLGHLATPYMRGLRQDTELLRRKISGTGQLTVGPATPPTLPVGVFAETPESQQLRERQQEEKPRKSLDDIFGGR